MALLPTVSALRNVRLRDFQGAAIVFCCGLLVTAFVAWQLARVERERDRLDFEKHASSAQNAVFDRVQSSLALLRGAAGLIAVDGPDVDPEAFSRFVTRLRLAENYPGVQGIGWTRRLHPYEVPVLEQRMRLAGFADFRIWPPGKRETYHAIQTLEPLDARNRAALGFDMATSAVRAAAMDRARDTGLPAATGRVLLVQEITADKQPGFLIYLPVYRGNELPATVERRQGAFLGHVYSPLRAGDFLQPVFAKHKYPVLTARIYDGTRPVPEALLYESLPAGYRPGTTPRFTRTDTLDVAGTPWTLVFESVEIAGGWRPTLLAAGGAGLLFSLLLALITWREARARALAAGWLARERSARNAAERASLVKDEFLATLSHELRTPLNAILGWAHVVRSGVATPEQIRTGLDAIDRNARVQVKLIDELLDMSRIVSGKLQLDVHPVDLAQLARTAVQSITPTAAQKRIGLTVKLPEAAPLRGDAARLQQVIGNLLANAIKFTPEAGHVEVCLDDEGSHLRLVVRDTGIGIDPDFLPYVFDRFRQADASRTRRHGGLGLGLAIVRQLVELHGGSVRAESAGPGQGARFVVTLPRDEDPPLAAAPPAGERARTADDFSGLRVLVVDDEPDARDLVGHVVRERGADVILAGSAQEALALVDSFRPEVMLSDIGMPGMDGYELIHRVRRRRQAQPLAIAISAYARAEDRSRAIDAGYDGYLVKPLHPATLVQAMAELRSRARRVAPSDEAA